MKPKIDSTNIMFRDFTEQPPGKKVVIFHKETMRGSLRCDYAVAFNGIMVFYLQAGMIRDQNTDLLVASFPIDTNTSWIMLDQEYIDPITTEKLVEKNSKDSDDLEILQKKYFPNMKPEPKQKQMVMVPRELGGGEEEEGLTASPTESKTYGQYL